MTTRPHARLVLLGASNLTLLLPRLARAAAAAHGGPIEVLAASGFGRSYWLPSRFLGRELPGILACGLWPALEESAPLPAQGIVMDVGNDLLYGAEPPAILARVEDAVRRLRPHVERMRIIGLPPDLERVGWLRFGLVRTLLVPGCTLSRADALRHARRLHRGLRDLAASYRARFVAPPRTWYGFDPLHVVGRARTAAAVAILGENPPKGRTGERAGHEARAPAPDGEPHRVPRSDALHVFRAGVALRRAFARTRRAPHVAVRLSDGTRVALY